MRVLVFLLFAAALAGCPATPYCHCQLSDRCVQFKEDCTADGITCNGQDGKDGRCTPDGGVGSCVVDMSRTDYFYSPQFTSQTAHATCDGGFFTPLP
jgi:hypothetical protein